MPPSQITYRKASAIKPYANNPRKNSAAVDLVAESIKRYGFQQPIVVDEQGVIVAGHTRWLAAKRIKMREVPVVVFQGSPELAQEYRLIDNRTSELAVWDLPKLGAELQALPDIEEAFASLVWPEVGLAAQEEVKAHVRKRGGKSPLQESRDAIRKALEWFLQHPKAEGAKEMIAYLKGALGE